ncbi:MAG: hypothetical protein C0504_14010 [Candidatus Solibacter sp.]|nr:hypothetical protein [Candidatus Solibacter sp.]
MNPDTGQEAAPLSEVQRLTGVFHSPGAVFGDIVRSGKWWIPLLISTVLGVMMVSAVQSRVSVDQMLDRVVANNEQFQQMSADRKEAALSTQRKIIPIAMYGGAVVGSAVYLFVAAGVLLFVFNLLMDGKLKYKNTLNICSYAGLPPGIVMMAAMMLVLYLKPPEEFDIQNALAFNAGAFLTETAAAWQKALLGAIDLFTFWTMFLVAVGFSKAIPKMTAGRAFGAILVPWIPWVLIKTGFTAVFS